MKATELRIGNLVFNGKDEVKELAVLDRNRVWADNEYLPEVKPIPITEEWLMKFGFEKTKHDGNLDYFQKLSYCLVFNKFNKKSFAFSIEINGKYEFISPNSIYFVHQLQNLYFALTGEELELK